MDSRKKKDGIRTLTGFFAELDELDELDEDESDDDDDGDGSRARFSAIELVTRTNDRSNSDRWRTLGALALLDLPEGRETCEREKNRERGKKTRPQKRHAPQR
jgi:hypothetical protein